jgi:hypothetical protein
MRLLGVSERFPAVRAVVPRRRIELLRHSRRPRNTSAGLLRFPCRKMSKNKALVRHFITHYHVLAFMPAK